MNVKILTVASAIVPLVVSCCVIALTGCTNSVSTQAALETDLVPYVTSQEFTKLLNNSSRPVLAEFSVPIGCARCDKMRPQIESLVTDLNGRAEVCRLNLNYERQLVNQLGITVCPTYVAFADGQELFRISDPTSGDMLMARLEDAASESIAAINAGQPPE